MFIFLVFSTDNIIVYYILVTQLNATLRGAVMAVIVWLLDLQLPMQSVPIATDVVSSNLDQGKVYNIM